MNLDLSYVWQTSEVHFLKISCTIIIASITFLVRTWYTQRLNFCCRLRPLPALSRRGAAKINQPRYGCARRSVWEKRVSRPLSGDAKRVKAPAFPGRSTKREKQIQNDCVFDPRDPFSHLLTRATRFVPYILGIIKACYWLNKTK